MPEASLEQRVEAVEVAVRELQRAVVPQKPNHDWLDSVIGSMQSEPAFEEVLAYGREIRNAHQSPENGAPLSIFWIPIT